MHFFSVHGHIFFWEELKKDVSIESHLSHLDFSATDLKITPLADAYTIMCGCWAVWTERNVVLHGEGGRSVVGSVQWALDTTYDLADHGSCSLEEAENTKKMLMLGF
jgi:hypothetical protein